MENQPKIIAIIICQIVLIFGSFITLVIVESQATLLGNSINVAGKNRLLASQFIGEVKDLKYLNQPEANPEVKLIELKENILLLNNGGTLNENKIPKLDMKFENEWAKIYENFIVMQTKYFEFKNIDQTNLTYQNFLDLELETNLFIQNSNILVETLGDNVKILSEREILLQTTLLIINLIVHVGLIFILIKIFQKEFKKNLKKEKLAIVGEFTARLSHDIRNPLSILQLEVELLKKHKIPNEKNLQRMENSIKRITGQVKEILNYVKESPVEYSKFNFNDLTNEILETLNIPPGIKIKRKGNNIILRADKNQIENLIINLLLNSIDELGTTGTIEIKTSQSKTNVSIEIVDSGSGITIEPIDQIFEPLITNKQKGTGLGLASVKSIVKNHSGTISVKNNPTTFTITLPNFEKQ